MAGQLNDKIVPTKDENNLSQKQPTSQDFEELAIFCYSLYKNNKELVEIVLKDK